MIAKRPKQEPKTAALAAGWLRKSDAARYVGISIRTLSMWQRRRLVSYAKPSHKVCLFSIEALDAALARFTVQAVDGGKAA